MNDQYVGNPFQSPAIISYCTGLRGLERGVERAIGTIRTAVIVEIEAFIIANLVAGMESGMVVPCPIWANLKTFDARPFRGRIHGIMGGYPCQPFSNAGNRKGTDDPRHLYPYLERDIEAIKPIWCFFENVSGHLTLGFDTVYRSLSGMGYAVEAGLYTAAEVGAPHERERLFILAIRKGWLGNAEYNGHATKSELRCNEKTSNERRQEESDASGKPSGTNRLIDAESLSGCKDRKKSDQSAEYLADTGLQRPQIIEQPATGPEQCGEKMEYTDDRRREQYYTYFRDIQESNEGYNELADSNNEGLQRMRECDRQKGWQEQDGYIRGGSNLWPARPGEPQYEWEEPRTVKPGMGSTINGYNFREDLLRALGNGVVEQTAEIAFMDLLRKHGITI